MSSRASCESSEYWPKAYRPRRRSPGCPLSSVSSTQPRQTSGGWPSTMNPSASPTHWPIRQPSNCSFVGTLLIRSLPCYGPPAAKPWYTSPSSSRAHRLPLSIIQREYSALCRTTPHQRDRLDTSFSYVLEYELTSHYPFSNSFSSKHFVIRACAYKMETFHTCELPERYKRPCERPLTHTLHVCGCRL